MSDNHQHHIVSYKTNIIIWIVLLIFTGLTVGAAQLNLQSLTVFTALLLATIKGTVVALYFMHLKFDNKILGFFVIITMIIFSVTLLLVFLDYGNR